MRTNGENLQQKGAISPFVLKLIKQTLHELPESQRMLYFYLVSFIHIFIQSNRDGCQVFGEDVSPSKSSSPLSSSASTPLAKSGCFPEIQLDELRSSTNSASTSGLIERDNDNDDDEDFECLSRDNLQALEEYYQKMNFSRRCLINLPFELVQYGIEEAAQFFFQWIWQVDETIFTSRQVDLLYTIFIVSLSGKQCH